MKTVHFFNLTNGIGALKFINNPINKDLLGLGPIKDPHFVRIQSTACEQKRWDFILQDLDHTFLLNLAIGNDCIVWDCSHKGKSRALYQGLSWIKFALQVYWFEQFQTPFVKTCKVTDYFNQCYTEYVHNNAPLEKKLGYYVKFLNLEKEIHLSGKWFQTPDDGNYELFAKKVKEELL
jgi:hypothetical protein